VDSGGPLRREWDDLDRYALRGAADYLALAERLAFELFAEAERVREGRRSHLLAMEPTLHDAPMRMQRCRHRCSSNSSTSSPPAAVVLQQRGLVRSAAAVSDHLPGLAILDAGGTAAAAVLGVQKVPLVPDCMEATHAAETLRLVGTA
jgi:hypothetical protein